MKDKEVEKLIKKEKERQNKSINLIASENIISEDVSFALSSCFGNKYGEGYRGARYYGGIKNVDDLEKLTQERALKLFHLSPKKWAVNVQAYSGSPANLAIFFALLPFGEKIMSMSLYSGGHLSHAQKVSLTGKLWRQVSYEVSPQNEMLDYKEIAQIAKKEKPKLIIAGGTAYSRKINFRKFKEIAESVKALLMVDMSHFAGLVAGGVYPSPFPYADIVMTTTHKTLRGPRGALIFSRKIPLNKFVKLNKKITINEAIDKAIFPGIQGGPHFNTILGIAVALKEAESPSFKKYIMQVVKNAKILANELKKLGWRIVSQGTDTHLFLVDVGEKGIGGKEAQEILEKNNIIVNKNTIPFEKGTPFNPSGIRIGTPFITSQGLKEKDMIKIAKKIDSVLRKLL
jgi:glycine hydroxymethyltransferase